MRFMLKLIDIIVHAIMENPVASKSRRNRINSSVPCSQTKQGWSCSELLTFREKDDTSSRRASPESDTYESVLEERIAARRTEIEQYANISELYSHLVEEGLLNHEEKEYLESGALDADKISRVLDSLKEKENGFSKFLACVKRETSHLGHIYIAILLEGRQFAPESDLKLSALCKQCIDSNWVKLTEKGVHLSFLMPHLQQKSLLTDDEAERLEEMDTEEFLWILDTKGPLARCQFASCLRAEREQKSHGELYKELFGDLDLPPSPIVECIFSSSHSNKRKNRLEYDVDETTCTGEMVLLTPQKRAPSWLEMDGPFKGKNYSLLMKVCCDYHTVNGQHDVLEREVRMIMNCDKLPLEFQALARVELALSCIFQGKNDRALELIEGADGALSICGKIPGNNAAFLTGRCMHLLSGLYRYAKQHDKAKEYAENAMVALHRVAPGLESTIANYVKGCILLESSDTTTRHPMDTRIIEHHFQTAITHGQFCEIAKDTTVPQSHTRLAQLYLGSTQYHHGTTTNPEDIKKARDSLNAVACNLKSISVRSKSLYYMAESDCYRARGDIPAAIDRAKLACSTAEGIQFILGVNSAEPRLKSLSEIPTIVGGTRLEHGTTEGDENYRSTKLSQNVLFSDEDSDSGSSQSNCELQTMLQDRSPCLSEITMLRKRKSALETLNNPRAKCPRVKYQVPSETEQWIDGKTSRETKCKTNKCTFTCDREHVLAQRIASHHKEIAQHTNIGKLRSYLNQEKLLNPEENQYLQSDALNTQKVSRVLDSLKEKPNGFTRFLACVKGERSHLGHIYVTSLLEGMQFASEPELQLSALCKQHIDKNLPRLIKGVNLSSLMPHLQQSFYLPCCGVEAQLLTDDDVKKLWNVKGTNQRMRRLFLILETKGPLAHHQFAACMQAECEHMTHHELFKDIFGNLNFQLEMDGVLGGNSYDKLMEKFYSLHHNSDGHQQLAAEAEKAMAQNDLSPELQALYRIELARSFIFRTQNEKAMELLRAALLKLSEKKLHNAFFIYGRCHYTLADLFRFTNDYERAKEHSGKALDALDSVKPGLDTANAHYINGCILLERHIAKPSIPLDIHVIERFFNSAISDGKDNDVAKRVTTPQSHCRLAQLYMSSAIGVTGNEDNLKKARQLLDTCKRCDLDIISQRSRYLYHVTESDWYTINGDTEKADDVALKAHQIAEKTSYALEILTLKTRSL